MGDVAKGRNPAALSARKRRRQSGRGGRAIASPYGRAIVKLTERKIEKVSTDHGWKGPARFRRRSAWTCRPRDGKWGSDLSLPVHAAWAQVARSAGRLLGSLTLQSETGCRRRRRVPHHRALSARLRRHALSLHRHAALGPAAALGNDLRELMDALSAQRAVLAGYDWGGRAACIVSALWPERVRGLVTGNSYNIQDIPNSGRPASPEQEHRLWYQYYFSTERGRAGLEANRKAFCRLLWKLWSPHWAFDDATFERSARSFDNPDFVAVTIQKPVSLRCQPRFVSAKPIYRSLPIRLILEIDVGRLLSIGVEDAAAVSFICWSLNRLN